MNFFPRRPEYDGMVVFCIFHKKSLIQGLYAHMLCYSMQLQVVATEFEKSLKKYNGLRRMGAKDPWRFPH